MYLLIKGARQDIGTIRDHEAAVKLVEFKRDFLCNYRERVTFYDFYGDRYRWAIGNLLP
jgi:hypothetical protein